VDQQFYYPGWVVEVDGLRVAARPVAGAGQATAGLPAGDHEGLIAFQLAAGAHVVHVYFGPTPLRAAAAAVSLVAALVLAGYGALNQGNRILLG